MARLSVSSLYGFEVPLVMVLGGVSFGIGSMHGATTHRIIPVAVGRHGGSFASGPSGYGDSEHYQSPESDPGRIEGFT